MSKHLLISAVLCLCLSFLTLQPTTVLRADDDAPRLTWGVRIPMRDGVKLNATVYRPKDQTGPLPVIFTLTPYISDSYHDRAMYFARHGYVFALVDCRGRGSSEGRFEPMANEAKDGYDLVEWFAGQPWSNGKVAMWGGSYAGYDQWATAKELPPHLTTIVPAASVYPGIDFPNFKNIFIKYGIQWLTLTSGVTPNSKLFAESSFWRDRFVEHYLSNRPFQELDTQVGNPSPNFQKWLQHPTFDDYWRGMTPTPEQYAKMTLPILTITGHYDGDQYGALTYYGEHAKYATREAHASHYLIIGPWDHAGTRTPTLEVGGLKFGEASQLDLNQLHKEWYDWTMKDGKKPEFLKDRVAWFVTEENVWKYAPTLEGVATERRKLYLDSDGSAADVFASGRLIDTPSQSKSPDRFVNDPLDTRPLAVWRGENPAYLLDQRAALGMDGNGVVYHTKPLPKDVELSGRMTFSVWLGIDAPDTDFEVSVYEIKKDGTSVYLSGDRMRARYRESLSREKLVEKDKIERYDFTGFTFVSRMLRRGSRLRLVLSGISGIEDEKNFNGGGVVSRETAKDAKKATVTVCHDAARPSFLEVPVRR